MVPKLLPLKPEQVLVAAEPPVKVTCEPTSSRHPPLLLSAPEPLRLTAPVGK